jgi:hypothetical protein
VLVASPQASSTDVECSMEMPSADSLERKVARLMPRILAVWL